MKQYTLKGMAEDGYIMGLKTIGDVATHMLAHHHAYFLTEKIDEEMRDFNKLVRGHANDLIDSHISDDDKRRLDADLERIMGGRSEVGPIS